MPLPIIGSSYLTTIYTKLKELVKPLFGDGIGDKMDKGNLWIAPGFTLLVFACLWTIKLSKLALDESTCAPRSNFYHPDVNKTAIKHCATGKRYFVDEARGEKNRPDPEWRASREVKNPEWILWFWAPIVFIMYVMTRFIWTVLLENQGIDFQKVVNSAKSVAEEVDCIKNINDEKPQERRLEIIEWNFQTAKSSRVLGAFLVFELVLALVPIFLLEFILPLMIGSDYGSWGFDVARAWWNGREWQERGLKTNVPLFSRVTYCDYHTPLGPYTYRCYLDSNWHERTALFIWLMLAFLAIVNIINLLFWIEWAIRIKFHASYRQQWVLRKWLIGSKEMEEFAEEFTTGNVLLFYYIEAHTSRVVASAFCQALFEFWKNPGNRPKLVLLSSQGACTKQSNGTENIDVEMGITEGIEPELCMVEPTTSTTTVNTRITSSTEPIDGNMKSFEGNGEKKVDGNSSDESGEEENSKKVKK